MNIRIKRNELLKESKILKDMSFAVENKDIQKQFAKSKEINIKQDEVYKKWEFYDKFIKSMEEVK